MNTTDTERDLVLVRTREGFVLPISKDDYLNFIQEYAEQMRED